eukprot:TRINITY_DN116_c0_g1_i2.p1 TRINITY_DN116_c0_g1~~TRINITY_DN116_c0_g1_i2.p1  ORF type:complete len:258 (+),score=56.87 TRINITY_DN116_c0_g1_i2:121-894(+)
MAAIAINSIAATSSSINGTAVVAPKKAAATKAVAFSVRAQKSEEVSRRSAVTLLAGAAAALTLKAAPAEAAYGEAANVFGKAKTNTDYIPYTGDGFSIDLPSKWNPSKEYGEYPNIVLRYEDNFDALAYLVVIAEPTGKGSITDFGSPEGFLEQYKYLLGVQAFAGETASEGGFEKNATVTASILESSAVKVNGKDYYKLNVLTRTADGGEGGRHQLFTAAVSKGKLYICKTEAGDKRWFKGAKKFVEGADKSFTVA